MIKLKDLIKEEVGKYAVNVQDTRNKKQLHWAAFLHKSDGNIWIKQMAKKYKLKRQKGFWGNPKTGIEILTNF
jgi:hypothetical protein